MHARHFLGAGFVAAAVPFLLAGCSGAPTSGVTPGAASSLTSVASAVREAHNRHSHIIGDGLFGRRHHHKSGIAHSWFKGAPPPNPLVYVADPLGNFVDIFSANSLTQVGQIGSAYVNEPQGLWVDVNQNLWVTNTGTQQILGFTRGGTSPFRTFNDPTGYPAGDCGNDNKNRLYSVDISGFSDSPGDTINVYNKATGGSPVQSFTDSNASSLYECVVDKHGNLFVTMSQALYPYGGEVDEFLKGSTDPIVIANNLVYPVGITFDKYGTLAVMDVFGYGTYGNFGTVFEYAPPYTSGPSYSFETPADVIQTALNHQQNQLWGAYTGGSYNPAGIQFSYPHGLLENSVTDPNFIYPDGIALSPAAKQ